MCLLVYLGSEVHLTLVEFEQEGGHISVENVDAEASARAHLQQRYVYYVGSYEGCGCGFNSVWLQLGNGLESVAEARSLLDAMKDWERERLLLEQASREQLRALIEEALCGGPVEIYACVADHEGEPQEHEWTVQPEWFVEELEPADSEHEVPGDPRCTAAVSAPRAPAHCASTASSVTASRTRHQPDTGAAHAHIRRPLDPLIDPPRDHRRARLAGPSVAQHGCEHLRAEVR